MTEDVINNVKNDYLQGMKYNDIMAKHGITQPELRSIIRKNKLTRNNKSKAQMGNKNAVGNKGGHGTENNKNAVTTGEYEKIYQDVLDQDELEIYNNFEVLDKEQLLINDYKILTIREKRMLTRIQTLKQKGKDMTINYIRNKKSKFETETITDEIERTDYELEQEENAIISYKELMEKKDSIQTIDEEEAIISIEELMNRNNHQKELDQPEETKLYNITEEEANDNFLNELKQFRKDL